MADIEDDWSATPSTFGEMVAALAGSGTGSFPRGKNRWATLTHLAGMGKQAGGDQ
jgi:hypothetical protein